MKILGVHVHVLLGKEITNANDTVNQISKSFGHKNTRLILIRKQKMTANLISETDFKEKEDINL